jgi:hypothetical protein
VLVLRYAGNDLTGVFDAPAFDQTDATDPVTGTLANVVHDQTLSASVDPARLPTRFDAVRPGVAGLATSWQLTAAPGHGLGLTEGPRLQAAAVAATDTTINATYGNPFQARGWSALVRYASSATRSYMAASGPITLSAGLATIAEAGTAHDFTQIPAGLPQTISIGLTRLTADGMQVAIDPSTSAVVSYIADIQTNTLGRAVVSELLDGGGATTTQVILDALSLDSTFHLPPGLLQPGHTYVIRIYCIQGGYPNAATGDLQTLTLPYSVGYADSGVFTVE